MTVWQHDHHHDDPCRAACPAVSVEARATIRRLLVEKQFPHPGFRCPPDPSGWQHTLAAWAVGALESAGWQLVPPPP